MMNRRIAAALIGPLAIVTAAGAWAQASNNPAQVKAGTYTVEPYHTQVGFTLSHLGFTEFSGVFSQVSGTLAIDPANIAGAKLDVTIPIASVLTTSTKLNEELQGAQWFDAAKFPTAHFVSTKVTPIDATSAAITGDFTLHGVTRPVTLKARFVGAGVNPIDKAETVGFSVSGTIKRTEFGVSQYAPLLGDEVRLSIAGAFVKAK